MNLLVRTTTPAGAEWLSFSLERLSGMKETRTKRISPLLGFALFRGVEDAIWDVSVTSLDVNEQAIGKPITKRVVVHPRQPIEENTQEVELVFP